MGKGTCTAGIPNRNRNSTSLALKDSNSMAENDRQTAAAQPGRNTSTPSLPSACHPTTDTQRHLDASGSSSPSEYQARLPGISGNTSAPRARLQPATSLREIHPNSLLQPRAPAHVPQGPAFQPAAGASVAGSFAAHPNFHGAASSVVDGIAMMPPMHPNPAAWAAITQMLPQHQQQQQQQVHLQQQSSNGVRGAPVRDSNDAFPSATTQAALRPTTLASSAQPAQQQGPASDAQPRAAGNTRPPASRQATGSRGPQLKWTVSQQVALMKQANASSEDRQKERKEVVWKRDAELLKKHEAFSDFVGRGGDLSFTKIRDKHGGLVKTARDKERRAQWESGVRADEWGKELIDEVDQALGTEEDLKEQRDAAAEGRLMVAERQERQGQEVVNASMGGRDCTTMVLRPSPTKGKNARRRSDPTDTPVDLTDTMSTWMQHKIDGSAAETAMNEKRHGLDQSKFEFEKEKQQKADENATRRAVIEDKRDEKRRRLESKRLKADVEMHQKDFEIRQEEMKLANKREDNRARESQAQRMQQAEQQKQQAEQQKQQSDMLLSLMKMLVEKK